MNRRGILFALVVSMGLAWMVFALMKGGSWFGGKAPEGPMVLVAKIDIPERQLLTPEMFVPQVVPAGMYAQMMVTALDPAVRHYARKPVMRGEILYQSALGNVNEEPELSYMIDRTQGVVSIAITAVAGVSGILKAGDYVDVFATYNIKYKGDGGEKTEPNTKRIVTGCRVVSIAGGVLPPTKVPDVAGNFSRQRTEAEVTRVTLAVSDTDLEKIIYAHTNGKIHLALKADDKKTGHPYTVYDEDDLQADLFNVVECIRAEDYRLLRVDR